MTSTLERTSLRIFTTKDASPRALDGQRVAVIGYGNLGRTAALNLRDSGVQQLVVGNIPDDYADQARADGFAVLPIGSAVSNADIVLVLLPDEIIPEVFAAEIAPELAPGSALVYASGYTLAYGLVPSLPDADVLLLAPRMGGEYARERYLRQEGFFAYISVEQDASGTAWERVLGLAAALGVLQAGALQLDARQEADLDLFVEQTVGAALGVAILSAFSLGVEAGIPPEAMVMEMYMSGEMETVFQAFRDKGFFRASDAHGPTALYGGFVRTMALMQTDLAATFRQTLEEIQRGDFARQFQAEREAGYPTLTLAQSMTAGQDSTAQPIAQAEEQLRAALGGSESLQASD
jgi:ketol-acid reductoisomerase